MNGDMDFMVLNGKLKDIQGSNTRQENSLSAIDEKMTDVSDKMDNLSVEVGVGAYIVFRGYPGTKFVLIRDDKLYDDISVEITENSNIIDDTINLRAVIVKVPTGLYSVNITFNGLIAYSNVNAEDIGIHYIFSYSTELIELARFTSDGTYTIQENPTFVTAAAGAGGGGGGHQTAGGNGGNGIVVFYKGVRVV